MNIPLYLLGLLRRFGPQHGYQIDKIVAEQISDFTRIKLPTVYYHLDRLASAGDLEATRETSGLRPDKTVFSINSQGEKSFQRELQALLTFSYRPSFDHDAVFYFSDSVEPQAVQAALARHLKDMHDAIAAIDQHESQARGGVPEGARAWAAILFDHHRGHYRAEAEWAQRSLEMLQDSSRQKESLN